MDRDEIEIERVEPGACSNRAAVLVIDEYFLCPPPNVSRTRQIRFGNGRPGASSSRTRSIKSIVDICDSCRRSHFCNDAALRRDWLDAQFLN